MTDLQTVADRIEIQVLPGEFSDAGMMRDYDRLAALFTEDGVLRIPAADVRFTGPEEIREGIERLRSRWEYFVQTAHPGVVRVDGDSAYGRAYIVEFGRLRDGTSHSNHSLYHDRYRRTPDGWRFTERLYEIRYLDTGALTGAPPEPTRAG
ncbi:nuclear transport factor 2 family protein [Streptomyces sp. SID13726]|uniref:nuclear transport factor 2 family protein n=1 Tax=Streptomyces sp. SID13726 TaxID=2706058 RepID=UPI0013BAA621|nr:nuclear transport factor 2 family protein [Streptomyces sp. SID13726]NEA99686.1 nuclear transport factor 2 family protein [Streptomyces sp. SID13726]